MVLARVFMIRVRGVKKDDLLKAMSFIKTVGTFSGGFKQKT
jgi:hypothetical protein